MRKKSIKKMRKKGVLIPKNQLRQIKGGIAQAPTIFDDIIEV